MTIVDLLREIGAVLRYVAAPGIGFLVTWVADDRHEVVRLVTEAASPLVTPPSQWPLLAFLVLVGVGVYFAHRIVFHRPITQCLVYLATRRTPFRPSVDDLAFARWERRGARLSPAP